MYSVSESTDFQMRRPDLSSVCETRGESYSSGVRFIGRSARPPRRRRSASPVPGPVTSSTAVFYLIYELQAPRSSTFKKRPGFIHMYAG